MIITKCNRIKCTCNFINTTDFLKVIKTEIKSLTYYIRISDMAVKN